MARIPLVAVCGFVISVFAFVLGAIALGIDDWIKAEHNTTNEACIRKYDHWVCFTNNVTMECDNDVVNGLYVAGEVLLVVSAIVLSFLFILLCCRRSGDPITFILIGIITLLFLLSGALILAGLLIIGTYLDHDPCFQPPGMGPEEFTFSPGRSFICGIFGDIFACLSFSAVMYYCAIFPSNTAPYDKVSLVDKHSKEPQGTNNPAYTV